MKRNWEIQSILREVIRIRNYRDLVVSEGALKAIEMDCLATMRARRVLWGYRHGLYSAAHVFAMDEEYNKGV